MDNIDVLLLFFLGIVILLVTLFFTTLGKKIGFRDNESKWADYMQNPQKYKRPKRERQPSKSSSLFPQKNTSSRPFAQGPMTLNQETPQPQAEKVENPYKSLPSTDPLHTLAPLFEEDSSFSDSDFISGATEAFASILENFAHEKKAALKPLLSPSVYTFFEQAIDQRNEFKQTLFLTLVSVDDAKILEARLHGTQAQIDVLFASSQITALTQESPEGSTVLQGSKNEIVKVKEAWRFERDLKGTDPNWKLIQTNIPYPNEASS